MDIINNKDKNPETFWLIEKRAEITKPGNFLFKIDGNLGQKVWVHRRPDKYGREEVAAIDLELMFKQLKRAGGADVNLSLTNQQQVQARSRRLRIHRSRTKTNPQPYQAPRRVKW